MYWSSSESEPNAASTSAIMASVSIVSILTVSLNSAFSNTVFSTEPIRGIVATSLSIHSLTAAPFDESNARTMPSSVTSQTVGVSLVHLT